MLTHLHGLQALQRAAHRVCSTAPGRLHPSGSHRPQQQQPCPPPADRRCRCRWCCCAAVALAVGLAWTVPCAQKLVACNPNVGGKACWDAFWGCTKSSNVPGERLLSSATRQPASA